jgi:predicted ATPase/signal transduction histidine kinase
MLAKLREGEFTLSRGIGDGLASILLVAPAGEYPSLGSLQHLEHEYALRTELDSNWAARPIELVRREARLMLVLEDPGGEPFERLLGRPLEIGPFLRIAVALAAAIGQMHARGLIHKDLKPANILVDVASGGVWLTGFGIASRLPRERQAPAPPEVIAGTLAYMAPEQTGRMNRSIDSRSDLYALGVTLYEMVTGALPFTASDPMEWIHCHIARRPTAPSERVSGIPDPVEAIILKLLAKTAEDRYQTAAGVEADLRRCLSAWEAHRRIDPFALAAHDVSDRLAIPERLYGREAEIAALLVAFDRVVTQGTTELVLVSGFAGIGKSSIANELHKMLVPRRGLFAAGKFDQYKRDIPYATLAQGFQSLVRQLLSADDEELSRWRNALLEALGPNGQLMVNLIPELALIVGEQPPLPDLPPQDRQARFQMVFRRLLAVFARPQHPLVLFLDDLQWLDAATLELIAHLVTEPEVQHLMLVGAYRDNEVDPSHPLMRTLEMIRKAGGRVEEIVLAPLKPDDVGQLIADSLHCEREIARPLAQLVHEKTDGNPFFAIQFFMALAEEALLVFDHGAAAWTWDLHRIRAKGFTDNVADLMAAKLSRLPDVTQAALGQLACLGNVAQVATIALVHGESEQKVHEGLWQAVRTGLVFRLGDAYAFLHDRVQEAAYTLIPERERAATHLRIGRALASRIAPEELEEAIFDIVNHLNRGAERIATQEERDKVAELNLIAGKRAKNASAYASALTYFASGAALLAKDPWVRWPELTLALELNRAECEFQTGALTAAEQRLTALSPRAATTVERASVTCLQADLYTTLDQGSRAIAVGLDYLRHLDIDWSSHPTDDEVHREYLRIWSTLGDRPIEILAELPLMSDPASLATLDVLTKISAPAWYTDANLASLVICRVVNLSLVDGNCDGSCYAYVVLGLIAGARFGDYRAGFRFGRLGCDLVEQRGLKRFQARTYSVFGNMVLPWTKHVRTGRDLVRRAFDAANKTGDLTFAGYCGGHLNTNLLAAGDPLDEVQGEAERGLAFAQKVRFGLAIDLIAAQLGLIRTLRGLTANFGCFDDEQLDELRMEHRFSSNPDLAGAELFYWIRKLQARFFAGDYAAALEAAERAQRTIWTSPSHFETAEYEFYGALAQAALWESAAASQRRQRAEALVAHHRKLEIWAANCPENFENRAALVGAEIARIEGRDADAMRLYEQAIRSARSNGFVHNEAIAYERASAFYRARGFDHFAELYLRNARYCYLRWGADGKVRQLEQLHPHLREESAPPPPTATFGAPIEQLDLATVVKIYQTVSGEIVLEKLIETLMKIAVEHAGAERGLMVLSQGDVQQIEAEATTGRDAVVVRLLGTPATPTDFPGAVLQHVIRTQESVILDDASAQNPFVADEYIRQKRARSVLCLPLVKQAKLIGVLYLENNLASHVFTPARISVLKLLSSQAAILLENARLYAKLSNENRDRRKAEDDLRRSEAALTEAQQISHTGSWRWKVGTGEVSWSAEHFRIFAFDPAATQPSYATFMQRIDPEDRPSFEQAIQRAVRERSGFQHEYRIVLPDGSVKHLQSVGQPDVTQSNDLEFVGTVIDITERRYAEEALRNTQAELARVARLTTMGELAASLSHEINQPLGAIVTLGEAGLRWLNREEPDLDEVRDSFSRMVESARRAGGVIRGLRALAKKSGPQVAKLDINDAIQEVLMLTRSELQRHGVVLRTEPSADDRPVFGDRVQLQQVVLNLIMNAVESMSTVTDRPKMLTITSEPVEPDGLLVAVEDTGSGLDPAIADRIFDSFVTTKPEGMGMGLSICRSIIDAHGGRISASARVPYGTVFRFTVPGIPPV